MVFAKLVNDGQVASRALRSVVRSRQSERIFTKRLLQSISSVRRKGDVDALKERHVALTSSSDLKFQTSSSIDILFRSKGSVGTWATAIKFLQQQVIDPGMELTSDHAARIVSLWSNNNDKPPARVLLQWWSMMVMERPVGFDDPSGGGDTPAMLLLPAVSAALADGNLSRQALKSIETESINTHSDMLTASAVEAVVASSQNFHSSAACELRAIEACLSAMSETSLSEKEEKHVSLLSSSSSVLGSRKVMRASVPTFTVEFDSTTGTMYKTVLREHQSTFNGLASAIVSSRPTPAEGVRLCDTFIGSSTPNSSCVLEELKIRYLFLVDRVEAFRYFDSIPEERLTPAMVVSCLRALVEMRSYESSVAFAQRLCDVWGSFTVPTSVMNRLMMMKPVDEHSAELWSLASKCRMRITMTDAICVLHRRPDKYSTVMTSRILPVDEVICSLGDMASLGKYSGAKAVIGHLSNIPKSRVGDSDDSLMLEVLGSTGDDWKLALEALGVDS